MMGIEMGNSNEKQHLAAILAADVAGYSRLMAADEHQTVVSMEIARTIFTSEIERWQGRVVNTAGDSLLVLFESAADAVNAALAVQKRLAAYSVDVPAEQRMRFRIGVHLGDVIEKPDGTVYGAGVNMTARLQALAEPGGVAVSDAVYAVVRGRVAARFEDQGDRVVKNIPYPVKMYYVYDEASITSEKTDVATEVPP